MIANMEMTQAFNESYDFLNIKNRISENLFSKSFAIKSTINNW